MDAWAAFFFCDVAPFILYSLPMFLWMPAPPSRSTRTHPCATSQSVRRAFLVQDGGFCALFPVFPVKKRPRKHALCCTSKRVPQDCFSTCLIPVFSWYGQSE